MSEARHLYSISKAAALIGVHPNTLRHWVKVGWADAIVLPSGHRRFTQAEVDRLRSGTPRPDSGKAGRLAA